MSAIEAFLEQDLPPESGIGPGEGLEDLPLPANAGWSPAALLEAEIAEYSLRLASESKIGEDLYLFVDRLADQLIDLPEDAPLRVDPYFLVSAQRATMAALRVLDSDDPDWARTQMRIRLEQLRQVFRDLDEGEAIYDKRPAKEVAAWLDRELDVSQARLAALLGVSTRTFQRWVSVNDKAAPDDEDARRLRVIAAAVNHLRHALTGPGVVSWLEAPNRELQGRAPLALLDEPQAAVMLGTLAAGTRSHSAF
jgi:DNA-binding transcriptional regulator YiaG